MSAGARADTCHVASLRRIPLLLAVAICACALGAPASALGAHRQAHPARCARRSSFKSTHTPSHRKGHATGCPRGRARTHPAPAHTHARPAHTAPHDTARPTDTAGNGECTGTAATPTQSNLEIVRNATLCLVNRERTSRGEHALQPNAHLLSAAQAHTESMAFGDYFEHDGPGGETPLDRMRTAGYIYSSQIGYEVGENIAWGTLWDATPAAIVAAWMASPGHRANILDANYRDTAVGVSPHPPSLLANGQPGAIYTQDFGVIITG